MGKEQKTALRSSQLAMRREIKAGITRAAAQRLLRDSSFPGAGEKRSSVRSFAVAVGGYNKMHTRQTREWAPPPSPKRARWIRRRRIIYLRFVWVGGRERTKGMLLLRLHTICCVCLWRVRLAPGSGAREVCTHTCTRFIGSPAMIKMPPRFLATSISLLVSDL